MPPAAELPTDDPFISVNPSSARAPRKPSEAKKAADGPQVLTFALQHRPRATRASVPKVRTGCLACKKRHVKCDEAKPACERCIKWQGFCDGYDDPEKPKISRKARASQSRPPSTSDSDDQPGTGAVRRKWTVASTKGSAEVILLEPDFNSTVFAHDLEDLYFRHWLLISNNMGGGWFETPLFCRTIPQLSRDEPVVRYAAMAIGALATAMAPNLVPKSYTELMANGPHYKNALTYYGRALRMVRLQQGPDADSALRSAVLCCLLFVSFESLHGNQEAALHHINHGLMIIEQFLRVKQPVGPTRRGTFILAPPPGYVNMADHSPAPFVLEDEVLQVFQRLDYLSWSTCILRSSRWFPPMRARTVAKLNGDEIPTSFNDLAHARRWWDLVQHWVLHFPRTVAEKYQEMAGASGEADVTEQIDLYNVPGVRDLQRQHLDFLERWSAAFAPLYAKARNGKNTGEPRAMAEYYRACSLQLQYLINWTCVKAVCFADYDTMYNMTPYFREMTRLGAVLLPVQPKQGRCTESFTLDNGPTLALFIVATKCRDEAVREDAIRLMAGWPRRDGFWDSRVSVAVSEINRDLEVENQIEGTLHEQWNRLRQREGVGDDRGTSMTIYYRGKNTATGRWEKKAKKMSWIQGKLFIQDPSA